MSYKINFSDQIANSNGITINDNTINTSTSLGFPGRNQKGYAVTIAENFLHLLENFAKNLPPANPIEGQLWYDTSPGIEELKVYDGTVWKPSGAVTKASSEPSNASLGDLWIDTGDQQVKLYTSAGWSIVGPSYSTGLKTGSLTEKIKDATVDQTEHVVLKNYVNDTVVSIISTDAFTPQSGIVGFDTIKSGINLSSNFQYYGTSEKAENLIIGGLPIPARNFLRSDVSNIVSQGFTIRNNSGLNLGNESQLQIRISDQKGVIYHSTPNTKLDIRLNVGSSTPQETTLISLDSTTGNIGIGINNYTPTETLSVRGTGSYTGAVKITDTSESLNSTTGALIVDGGVSIKKKLRVTGEVTVSNQINSLSIIPTGNNLYNIGYVDNANSSNNLTYQNVYASNFSSGSSSAKASFIGNLTGNVNGDVNGAANKLKASSTFTMTGDVIDSTGFSFNGQDFGLQKVFNTSISSTFITTKTPLTDSLDSDEFIVYRPFGPGSFLPGLYKTTKKTLINNLALVPVGSIFPYAGASAPPGYLLCDGSEKQIGTYRQLYNVIGLTYTPNTSNLVGVNTFKLPDLRGRFPLGLDNMDNGDKVTDSNNHEQDSGGGSANRVTSSTASTLGNAGGYEQVTLDLTKIPDHKHNLKGDNGGQYYVTNNKTEAPSDTNSVQGNSSVSTVKGQSLSTTGTIDTNATLGQPVNIMNPYLAMNYIIYSGVYS